METKPHFSILATSFAGGPRPRNAAIILGGLWLLLYFAALFAPPLLDDADATHAQAAQHMALSGNLITLHVDGIRYLEKAPLPYWLAALCFKLFGFNTFAAHLPQAFAVLLLALLGHRWANHAFGSRTAFYTALSILTSIGVFLFTRILIPEIFLSLFLATALYAFLRTVNPSEPTPRVPPLNRASPIEVGFDEAGLNAPQLSTPPQIRAPHLSNPPQDRVPQVSPLRPGFVPANETSRSHNDSRTTYPLPLTTYHSSSPPIPEKPAQLIPLPPTLYPYIMWASLALAVLSKGLVALVFFAIPTLLYLALTDDLKKLKQLRPATGLLLFLAIAAPWHLLAALRNPATANHPGFLWFYFWNEHVLRFLGRRTPADYNKLPGYLYWLQHLAWLFPWSLFLPLAVTALWRRFKHQTLTLPQYAKRSSGRLPFWTSVGVASGLAIGIGKVTHHVLDAILIATVYNFAVLIPGTRKAHGLTPSPFHRIDHQQRHILLLALLSATVLLFFSLSTNQEYYTFPAYLPLLLLLSATITRAEQTYSSSPSSQRWITFAHATLFTLGALIAIALATGLIASRHLPYTQDIGSLLAHRSIGDYTLSTSHLFDLTFPAFAALRLPAILAAVAFTLGPFLAFALRQQRRHLAATTTIAFTSALFLLAAQIAFARFAPLLSSKDFATRIQSLEAASIIPENTPVSLYGDQAFGSSLIFYLQRPHLPRPVSLVDGRSTSMLFGSTFEDAPPVFLTPHQLTAQWGRGPRHLLFVPAERRAEVDRLLGPNQILLKEESGKALLTDRPLP